MRVRPLCSWLRVKGSGASAAPLRSGWYTKCSSPSGIFTLVRATAATTFTDPPPATCAHLVPHHPHPLPTDSPSGLAPTPAGVVHNDVGIHNIGLSQHHCAIQLIDFGRAVPIPHRHGTAAAGTTGQARHPLVARPAQNTPRSSTAPPITRAEGDGPTTCSSHVSENLPAPNQPQPQDLYLRGQLTLPFPQQANKPMPVHDVHLMGLAILLLASNEKYVHSAVRSEEALLRAWTAEFGAPPPGMTHYVGSTLPLTPALPSCPLLFRWAQLRAPHVLVQFTPEALRVIEEAAATHAGAAVDGAGLAELWPKVDPELLGLARRMVNWDLEAVPSAAELLRLPFFAGMHRATRATTRDATPRPSQVRAQTATYCGLRHRLKLMACIGICCPSPTHRCGLLFGCK